MRRRSLICLGTAVLLLGACSASSNVTVSPAPAGSAGSEPGSTGATPSPDPPGAVDWQDCPTSKDYDSTAWQCGTIEVPLRYRRMLAAERRDPVRSNGPRLERQYGQVQTGRPALGSLRQLRDRGVIEIEAYVAHQGGCFLHAQLQLARRDFQHAPLRPQPGQRQCRLFPARHDDP